MLLHVEVEEERLTEADTPFVTAAPGVVVFVHGLAARLGEFDRLRACLRGRARLVLFDQRGHGRSGWGGRRSATVPRLGRDLGQVLDATTPSEPVVLVGHSLGGIAILALALLRPELFGAGGGRVVGVALLSTSAGDLAGAVLPQRIADAARRLGLLRACAWWLWVGAPLLDRIAPFRTLLGRRLLRRWLFVPDQPPDQTVRRMQRSFVDTSTSMAAAFLPDLVRCDLRDALPVLAGAPAVVITGARDNTIPPQHGERIARGIGACARLVEVPDAGHMVDLTHPDAVCAALDELLDRAAQRESPLPYRSTGPGVDRSDDEHGGTADGRRPRNERRTP